MNIYTVELNGIKVNPEMLRHKATMIANEAKLHHTTVQKIISGTRKSCKPETRDAIRDAIIKLFSQFYVVTDITKIKHLPKMKTSQK